MKEVLIRLGAEVLKFDDTIFTWNLNGKLHGIISTHVDDFLWGGSKVFQVSVIDKIRSKFVVKSEDAIKFKYLGLDLKQSSQNITLNQYLYVQKLDYLPVHEGLLDAPLSSHAKTMIWQANGELNWIVTQTCPDLSFDISECNSLIKKDRVDCFRQVYKHIKKAKKEKSQVVILNLGCLSELSIIGYSDASFAKLDDGGSQGGYIIFIVGKNGKYFPLY